jgi:hypothetical protein
MGFLGTAFPRLLDVPRVTLGETLGFAGALLATAGLHFTGHTAAGDELFFMTLVMLVLAMAFRSILRKDTPPPAFILVGLGILSALAGDAVEIVGQIAPTTLAGPAATMGRLLLFQGYLLLPIMGIGAFLLPRFFSMPGRQSFPDSTGLPPGWKRRALFALVCGMALILSFALEAAGWLRWGYGLRAGAVILYFIREVPVHRAGLGGGTLALGIRVALVSIPCGYILMTCWPARAISFLHIVFITGFSLITLTVATRVILGHSGQSHLFRATLRSMLLMVSLLAVAMLTRVSADWMPAMQMRHYAYAALLWIAGVLTWIVVVLPGVRHAGSDE